MRDEGSRGTSGKYRQRYQQPIDNPEVSEKKDWWDEVCKAHGAKNFWDKNKKKKEN